MRTVLLALLLAAGVARAAPDSITLVHEDLGAITVYQTPCVNAEVRQSVTEKLGADVADYTAARVVYNGQAHEACAKMDAIQDVLCVAAAGLGHADIPLPDLKVEKKQ